MQTQTKFDTFVNKGTLLHNYAHVFDLIMRLRQNVIRAGLRNISLAYSKIYLSDVAKKLALDHPEDMESIAAKAIRDGVIDATRLPQSRARLAATTRRPQGRRARTVEAQLHRRDRHRVELVDAVELRIDSKGFWY